MQTNRRSFLKASGLAAVVGATALAGCSDPLGGGGGQGDWVYDPDEVADVANVVFGRMAYGRLYENRDELPQSMQASFEGDEESPIQPADIEEFAGAGGGAVSSDGASSAGFGSFAITGSIPRSEMEAEMEAQGDAAPAGSYEGYSMYDVSDIDDDVGSVPGAGQFEGSGAIAVGDEAMLVGFAFDRDMGLGASGAGAVRTMIDASAGNARRLGATSGPAKRVLDRVGDSHMAAGAEVDPDLVSLGEELGGMGSQFLGGLGGGGIGIDIDGETSTVRFAAVYDSEQSASEAGIADLVSGMEETLEDQEGVDDVESSQDGEVIVVTITGETAALAEQGAGAGPTFDLARPR